MLFTVHLESRLETGGVLEVYVTEPFEVFVEAVVDHSDGLYLPAMHEQLLDLFLFDLVRKIFDEESFAADWNGFCVFLQRLLPHGPFDCQVPLPHGHVVLFESIGDTLCITEPNVRISPTPASVLVPGQLEVA